MASFRCFAIALAIVAGLFPSELRAELDLVPAAHLETTAATPSKWHGLWALRDADPTTDAQLSAERAASLMLDLSPAGESLALTIDRVEIDWGESAPETVALYGGIDRWTLARLAGADVSEARQTILVPDRDIAAVRFLRLDFAGAEIDIARLAVYAKQAPALGATPQLQATEAQGLVSLTWTATTDAHRYEIERDIDGDALDATWTALWPQAEDRPPYTGAARWRVRAVDYRGAAGPWSDWAAIEDYSPQPPARTGFAGVVEGYYGPPLTHAKRLRIVRQLGVWNLDAYLYAPKNAPKHRELWRDLYTEAELSQFAELLETGRDAGVAVYYGISPGKDIDPLADEDFAKLAAKLAQLVGLGYTHFALLMDDIQVELGQTTGANHAALANRLYDWLAGLVDEPTLLFVPTVYSGTAGGLEAAKVDYLEALQPLYGSIAVAWTGRGVFVSAISADEAAGFAALAGHPVWIWDNYPVNDALGYTGEIHLAPLEGRDPALMDAVAGYLVNPMPEGMASLFALSSVADYTADPATYDPDAVSVEAVRAALGPKLPTETWEAWRSLFTGYELVFPGREAAPEAAADVGAFLSALTLGEPSAVAAAFATLAVRAAELQALADAMRRGPVDPLFADEIRGHADKLAANAEAALAAANLLNAGLYDARNVFLKDEARLAELKKGALAADPLGAAPIAADTAFAPLFDRTADDADVSVGRLLGRAWPDPITAPPLPQARAGQVWNYDAGFAVAPETEWKIVHSTGIDAIDVDPAGLVGLQSSEQETFSRAWFAIEARQGEAAQYRVVGVEVLPALAAPAPPTLPLTAEIANVDGQAVLLQNGVVVPDAAFSTYSRYDLGGSWRKRRMALDHALTLGPRDEAALARLAAESGGAIEPAYDDRDWETADLPSVENRLPPAGHPSGPEVYFGGVWYRREVSAPSGGRQIRLAVLASGYVLDAWADGVYLGHHEGGVTPAYFPLPDTLAGRDRVTLALRIDNPPPGWSIGMLTPKADIDWFPYTGVMHGIRWEHLSASKRAVLARVSALPITYTGKFQLDAVIENLEEREIAAKLVVEIFTTDNLDPAYWSDKPFAGLIDKPIDAAGEREREFVLPARGRVALRLSPTVVPGNPWELDHPRLYALQVTLRDADDESLDRQAMPLGLRTVRLRDEGTFAINDRRVFGRGAVYVGDSAERGRDTNWEAIRIDLQRLKDLGADFMSTGPFPAHPAAYVLADRLGLAAVVQLPLYGLDREAALAEQERPIAEQVWREMIFAHANRPSVVVWSACRACAADAETAAFVERLHRDLDAYYPDDRLVTASAASVREATGFPDLLESVDLPSVEMRLALGERPEDGGERAAEELMRIRDALPGRAVLAIFGAPSAYDGSGLADQADYAEAFWDAVLPLAQNRPGGGQNKDGFVMGVLWQAMYDYWNLTDGLATTGLRTMSRAGWKPADERLRTLYTQFKKGVGGDDDFIAPNKAEDSCQSVAPSGIASLLLALAFLFRRRDPR